MTPLRIGTGFNERTIEGWYFVLYCEGRPLDEVADQLGLVDGMSAVFFNEEPGDAFEFDGVLRLRKSESLFWPKWVAILDERSFRASTPTHEDGLR